MQPCDLYHHVYPAMSNLHSKQHPTEDIVTIKYASLMYLFKRKADFYYYFKKFIVTKLSVSDCSPEEMDQ